jgi:hypothetical protein
MDRERGGTWGPAGRARIGCAHMGGEYVPCEARKSNTLV